MQLIRKRLIHSCPPIVLLYSFTGPTGDCVLVTKTYLQADPDLRKCSSLCITGVDTNIYAGNINIGKFVARSTQKDHHS